MSAAASSRRVAVRTGLATGLVVAFAALAGCTGPAGTDGRPTTGSVTQTVPAVTPPAPKTVGLSEEGDLGGLRLRVVSVTARDVESTVPTEGKGPALVFVLSLRNVSGTAYRTEQLETTLIDSAGGAASRVTGAPATAFPAELAPGVTATASFVYLVALDKRSPVALTVSAGAGRQPVEFRGNA